jgi:hypothetical protein
MPDDCVSPGAPPLSLLWDNRPLHADSWGNVLAFNDGSSYGETIMIFRWVDETPHRVVMNPLVRYLPVPPLLGGMFANGGSRRFYIPREVDLAIVKKHFPDIANPANPPWPKQTSRKG